MSTIETVAYEGSQIPGKAEVCLFATAHPDVERWFRDDDTKKKTDP